MDATAAPADIKFPADIDLLNKCREHLETADGIIPPGRHPRYCNESKILRK